MGRITGSGRGLAVQEPGDPVGHDGPMTELAPAQRGHTHAPPTMLYLVKQLELAVRSQLDDVLRPVAVTPLQYTALTVLERRSDLSTAELARNSFVTDQSAADMVGALTARDLVRRVPDTEDRRRRVLQLTPAGQALLDQVRADVMSTERRMLSPLTGQQAEDLRRYVVACHGALSEEPPH